jgi:DNA transformation protein and related proteins
MPTPIPDFATYCCELLNAAGRVSPRRMFGGFGLSVEEMNIALIISDTLYLKVDAESRTQFERAGCVPFSYDKKDGTVGVMSYFTAPEEAMESPAEMAHWARLAMAAARRAAAGKPAKKPAPKKTPAKKIALKKSAVKKTIAKTTAKTTAKPTAKKTSTKKPKSAPQV